MNPGQYRAQNEKITDKLRGMFEKATGKKVGLSREVQVLQQVLMRLQVPSKISN